MELWQLTARERIRDTLARYNWSGDAGHLDDMAMALKCIDQIDRRTCREVAERRFSIGAMVDAHVELYTSIT